MLPQSEESSAARPSLSDTFQKSRLRPDTWNQLKEDVRRLERATETKGEGSEEAIAKARAAVAAGLEILRPIERYWAFPGQHIFMELLAVFEAGRWRFLERLVTVIARLLSTDHYRNRDWSSVWRREFVPGQVGPDLEEIVNTPLHEERRPYFEVLVVDSLAVEDELALRSHHLEYRRPEDEFVYDVVVVRTLEDAAIALLLNYNIQACVVRYSFPFASDNQLDLLGDLVGLAGTSSEDLQALSPVDRSGALGRVLRAIRPELDLYLLSEATVEKVASELHRDFRRVFFGTEDYLETHLTILKGIEQRFETPFFNALRTYTRKPTGVFHAMPISRGKSISKSHWISDYGQFYGERLFLSETSATTGGLDSLLQPSGSIKRAQELAARAFGADQTFFVTNGTSTANKIVLQAITRPGDIVLLSNECHKSHHYAAILAGVCPVYLSAYSLDTYSMYGAVPLETIKGNLLKLRAAGQLERVRAVLLTNLTFDGLAYDVERVMTECLAIKPDLVFLWDEAWFAYGRFTPLTRGRTAMHAADSLRRRFQSDEYAREYEDWRDNFEGEIEEAWLRDALLPDPATVRVRAYATHSTHKTLTALRQASMIHISDDDFGTQVAVPFREAYMTFTSTSPNYQIVASLDIARRQVEFEGYELVQKAVELATIFRRRISEDKTLARTFRTLGPTELIPAAHRGSGIETLSPATDGWKVVMQSWLGDEFALDPSRITLDVSRTGLTGDEFKQVLMNRFDVQVNKTSRNTVLLLIHIGSTRGMITYLLESLATLARELDERLPRMGDEERRTFTERVASLERGAAPLPNFSGFHAAFRDGPEGTPAGDMRRAFYAGQAPGACRHLQLGVELDAAIASGEELVSASFVTPYPPGFPVLVPGQLVLAEVAAYLAALDVKEVHGFDPVVGLQVFSGEALRSLSPRT
ncbi:MAG: arginine decarboxylase [Planctomycetota bacterium]|jgi:arginine decarboxylase